MDPLQTLHCFSEINMETEEDVVRASPCLWLGCWPRDALPFVSFPCSACSSELAVARLQLCLPAACCMACALIPLSAMAGQTGSEEERPQLVLLVHSWICSSGRCKHQGTAYNPRGCKTARKVQMTTLIFFAPHCRGWHNVSG